MPTTSLSVVFQNLSADLRPVEDGVTDGELLARFQGRRDEDALAVLVRRHAPMVWGVCRRLLNHHDGEDAFQATFLVLVRKAGEVPAQAVANWLYGVARQTAVRLRATAAKRRRRETQMADIPEAGTRSPESSDLRVVLDEELGRLPDHYRSAIVLCDLEGMTRKEAARQLGIPEGSAASRLARGRSLLAKRLTRRGVVISGLVAVVPLARSASPPPALVGSTIKAASLLAAGQAAGVVSAQVAALTEGVVQNMFVTKIKSVLAAVLVVAAIVGAAGLLYPTRAAEPPKDAPKKANEKPVSAQPTPPPANADRELMVGNWFITNEDSLRQGEMWVITEDSILVHAKDLGLNTQHYAHRLDAGKNPKQIDITVSSINGATVGVIKGIYALDGDELRLCLGEIGKDRPAAFPEQRKPGEVLVLRREKWDTTLRTTKDARPEQKVLTPQEAIKRRQETEEAIKRRQEKVTVQFKVTTAQVIRISKSNVVYENTGSRDGLILKDGDSFAVQLLPAAVDTIRRLGIEPDKHFTGKVVRVTGQLQPRQPDFGTGQFQIVVTDLTQFEVVGK